MKAVRSWSAPGDVYVLDALVHRSSKHLLGLLSNGKLRVISSPDQDAFSDVLLGSGTGTGQARQVTGIACAGCSLLSSEGQAANLVWSCSVDGTVAAYDLNTRTPGQPVGSCSLPRTKVSSVDVGLNGMLVACGTEEGFDSKVVFWDVRNLSAPLGKYVESHSDHITAVRFSPDGSPGLVSGSEDGLVCAFDVSKSSETAALKSVLKAGSAVSRLGFFGANFQGIYVTTTTETLSLFEIGSCAMISSYDNDLMAGTGCRETLQETAKLEINYLIDCLWEPRTQKLLLCAGNTDGVGFGFEMTLNGFVPLGPLPGGHSEVIRTAKIVELGPDKGGFGIVTGGEDGKMCIWTPE